MTNKKKKTLLSFVFYDFVIFFSYIIIYFYIQHADSHPRGLEHSVVQRDGKNEPLGRSLFRDADDFRQLRPVQFAGRNFGRRIFL